MKLWPTGRYLLSAFSVSFENPNNKTNSVLKAGSASVNRDVSCLCGRHSPRIKFLPLFCSGVARLARSSARSWHCIQSGRLMKFSRFGIKNCRPVIVKRLQVFHKNKNPPRKGPKDFVVDEWRQNGSVWAAGRKIKSNTGFM